MLLKKNICRVRKLYVVSSLKKTMCRTRKLLVVSLFVYIIDVIKPENPYFASLLVLEVKPLGVYKINMDLSNGFERPSSKGSKLLFPVIKANTINPLGPPFKLFQCNCVSYNIKRHMYIRIIFRWCTSRKEGQDSGGACATHMQSTRHNNPILLSANTRVVWGWRDDIDGEPRRTSVCVNNSQSLCHQLLKKGEGGAKLE